MTTVLERPIVFDSVLATVAAVDDLSPHLRRVTFVAPRIADAVTAGPDQRIKVLLSPPDGSELKLPSGPEWYTEWCAQPAEERFIMRTYTVRALRPEVAEIDIEFVLHGVNGPASAWVSEADRRPARPDPAVRGRHHQYQGPAALRRRLRPAGHQRPPGPGRRRDRAARARRDPRAIAGHRPRDRLRRGPGSPRHPSATDAGNRRHHLDRARPPTARSRCSRHSKPRISRTTPTTPGWPASRR